MLSTILFALAILLLLTLINGAFAMAEMALVSTRKARLAQKADAGDTVARAALDLVDNPTRFLSTVQLGMTLVGIVAGAFGGASLSTTLATQVRRVWRQFSMAGAARRDGGYGWATRGQGAGPTRASGAAYPAGKLSAAMSVRGRAERTS